ncbi:MAG: hypothetical protein V5783_07450 [Pontiella sp.]
MRNNRGLYDGAHRHIRKTAKRSSACPDLGTREKPQYGAREKARPTDARR